MSDVWRVTVGDKVQESESFTPLMNILQKLVNRRQPFKVGFGTVEEVVVAGADERHVLGEHGGLTEDF